MTENYMSLFLGFVYHTEHDWKQPDLNTKAFWEMKT